MLWCNSDASEHINVVEKNMDSNIDLHYNKDIKDSESATDKKL